jgi:hypothetical protein
LRSYVTGSLIATSSYYYIFNSTLLEIRIKSGG